MATLEQQRAAFALAKVEQILKLDDKAKAKYKTQLLKLPARLHTSGLGQTVAFYLTAGPGKPEVEICSWLEAWLRGEGKVYGQGPLIAWITGRVGDPGKTELLYRQASMEARALAVWLKRFAEAFVNGSSKNG